MKLFSLIMGIFLFVSVFAGGAVNLGSIGIFEPYALARVESMGGDDFDPLVDIVVTVEIQKIRSLETDTFFGLPVDKIDFVSDPDFYVKVLINGQELISPVWEDQKYVYEPKWLATLNVPDDVEFVNITIQLWDANLGTDTLCDISDNDETYPGTRDITVFYSIKSGHWYGDDEMADSSGYGRANGCDDNSIYQRNTDCELWFDIYQNDYDGDGIPYWTEVNIFDTSPEVDNRGMDADNDGVPIEWENKWGHLFHRHWGRDTVDHEWIYHANEWEDHASLDPDNDGLDNMEEYLISQWGSDPFRKDLFIEMDQMAASSDGIAASVLPEKSKELLQTAYNKHNIVYHLDDGCMGGGEMIPFKLEVTGRGELSEKYYTNYFLHNDENNWRQGIFHYSIIAYDAGFNGFAVRRDMWQISSKYIEEKCNQLFFVDPAVVYASVYMHETGHSLDIYNPGVDNPNTIYPWQSDYWKYRPYKSCMNYGYTYILVDYSDGSRGMNDFADWNDLDLTYFESDWH